MALAVPGSEDAARRATSEAARADFDFQRSHVGRAETETLRYRLQRPVANAAKTLARRYGTLTAARRTPPDFLVIGAKRAGSTTLYRGMVAGGGIAPMFPARERRKGVYFFDVHYERGPAWYLGHMERRSVTTRDSLLVGEASPYYLSHPHAAARAASLLPDARIIVVLRDPIERAHSHYRERWKQGIEYLPTFDEAVAQEDQRVAGEVDAMLADPRYVSWEHLNFGYAAQSEYGTTLGRWLDVYPPSQILVLRAEDLYADPATTIDDARRFVGLDAVGERRVEHHNQTSGAEMGEATRSLLTERLGPEVAALERRLERSFGWSTG